MCLLNVHTLLNFPSASYLVVSVFISSLIFPFFVWSVTLGRPSPFLFCNCVYFLVRPCPCFPLLLLYALHTVCNTLPSSINSPFSLDLSIFISTFLAFLSHIPRSSSHSSSLHRMSQALAWTLAPSVTCGKSSLKK